MKILYKNKIPYHILINSRYTLLMYSYNKKLKKYCKFSLVSLVLFFVVIFYIMNYGNIKLKTIISRKSIYNEKNERKFYEKLKHILDKDEIFENEMMDKHTTFQLGGPAKVFIIPKSINKLSTS